MPVVVPVYFDYASSLCYIAWRIVSELQRELDVVPLWKGVPISARDRRIKPGQPLTAAQRFKVAMVAAETGISATAPSRWLDSQAALEGAELAREAGVFGTYHAAVFRAAFEAQLDIGDPSVLAKLAAGVGMDAREFLADLQAHKMVAKLEANKREAEEFSALGYPTFMFGRYPFTGIQHIDTMRMLFRRFLEVRIAEGYSH
jgi:predicted DsbA family dithiol-disulfide isomerase